MTARRMNRTEELRHNNMQLENLLERNNILIERLRQNAGNIHYTIKNNSEGDTIITFTTLDRSRFLGEALLQDLMDLAYVGFYAAKQGAVTMGVRPQ